jgi:hypothetical protein
MSTPSVTPTIAVPIASPETVQEQVVSPEAEPITLWESVTSLAVYSPIRHLLFTVEKIKDIATHLIASIYHAVKKDPKVEKEPAEDVTKTDQSLAKLNFHALVHDMKQFLLTPISFIVTEAELGYGCVRPMTKQWHCTTYLQSETIFYHRRFFRLAGRFD